MHFVTGDATYPVGAGQKIIAHVCNDIGAWGAGFVLSIERRWKEPQAAFLRMQHGEGLILGDVGFVRVEDDTLVANMIAQRDIKHRNGLPPIRYDSLRSCLSQVARFAKEIQATVHMPRIGCGLAGGKWEVVAPIITETLEGIEVFIYDHGNGNGSNRRFVAAGSALDAAER